MSKRRAAPNAAALGDQPARDRIASDFRTNLLVEAGAGSGKTHMMAVRMARAVAAGVCDIEHMAAVTFTRKAAAELRGRFQETLEQELRGATDMFTRANLGRALGSLERFFAGTIHAFCAHLLRQHPVEAGLSPVFDELDEVQDKLDREQAWREFLRHARASGHPLLQELRDTGVKQRQLDAAFATLCDHEDVDFPAGDAARPDTAGRWAAVDAFADALRACRPTTIDREHKCGMLPRLGRFDRQLAVTRTRRDSPAALASVLTIWDATPKATYKWWSPGGDGRRAQALWESFRAEVVTPFIGEWRRYLYRLTIGLLLEARAHASAGRRRRNTLNYNDLLLLTAQLLRERPDVREALQQKVRHLFVDEFQDTDPLQAEIIFLLAGTGGETWRDVTLRDAGLFVVGDPKQSIYRFRRADIEIYNQVRASIERAPNGRVETLTSNFRSTADLCEWANGVFAQKFPTEATAESPAFSPLDARPNAPVSPGAAVFRLSSVATRRDEARDVESRAIARYIRAEIDSGRRRPGDFLILTRTKKPLATYMAALEQLSIPVEVSGAGAFARSPHVAALAALLRALGDPQDALTLVGVLRGPFFGISDPELWRWKQQGGRFTMFAPDSGTEPRVAAALTALSRHYRWTRQLPLPAAIDRVLDDTGFLALVATSPDGVEAGDLVHAIDRVRRTMEQGGTLADAAAALGDDVDGFADIESLPLEPGRSDVVRVMNLHKAKGLEAPVVFLADPNGGPNPTVTRRIVRQGDAAIGWIVVTDDKSDDDKWRPAPKIAEPEGWDAHQVEEKRFLDAEEIRLLYVAATRARDMLVVGCTGAKSGAWKPLEVFVVRAPELDIPDVDAVEADWARDASADARAAAAAHREAAQARARTPSWSAASVTGEARHIEKLSRREAADEDDPTKVVVADTRERRADAGMAWGSLVHGLLEHAMRHEQVSEADLRRLALWLTVETPELRQVIDEAVATVVDVMGSEFWARAKAAPHFVETPFAVKTSDRDVLFGMVDLMFDTPDGWQLVDYKTDATLPAGSDAAAAYARQLAAYHDAMSRCGVATAGAVLHQVRRGTSEEQA